MRVATLLIAIFSASCALSTASTVQSICTVDDPNCGDPGGGGGNTEPDIAQLSLDYGSSVLSAWQQAGYQAVGSTFGGCAVASNYTTCGVTLDFGSFTVATNCTWWQGLVNCCSWYSGSAVSCTGWRTP